MGRVLIAGFTAALLLLGTVLIYLMRAPRSRREVLDVASLPPPAPSPARRPLPAPALAREVPTAPEGPRVSSVGRLSGRVMGGGEAMMAPDELEVEVVDESGSRPAVTAATKGRDFQARLPPGTYTVTARIDDLVGKVSGVQVKGREEIQILLVLQPASVLAGRVVRVEGDGELPRSWRSSRMSPGRAAWIRAQVWLQTAASNWRWGPASTIWRLSDRTSPPSA